MKVLLSGQLTWDILGHLNFVLIALLFDAFLMKNANSLQNLEVKVLWYLF